MHFINRNILQVPEKLAEYKELYTDGWLSYIELKKIESQKPKGERQTISQPTDNEWNNDLIREPLVKLFKSNCGYCGKNIFKKGKVSGKGDYPLGHVDHFIPKSVDGNCVYEWKNYVWSCKNCNGAKQDFYDEKVHILDPCNKLDTEKLIFNSLDGSYSIVEDSREEEQFIRKYNNTNLRTTYLIRDICEERALIYFEFDFILAEMKEKYNQLPNVIAEERISMLKNSLELKISKNKDFIFLKIWIIEKFIQRTNKGNYKDFIRYLEDKILVYLNSL